jgi:nucleolar protein 4
MGKPREKKRQRDTEDVDALVKEAVTQDEVANATPRSKRARTETNKSLFIRSLPPSATSESLTEFFSQHYPVKHATVVLDPKTKTSRGYGFVSFADPEDALEAKEKLNNHLLDGRRLRLDIAQPRHRDGGKGDSAISFVEEKRKREEALAEARKAPKLIIRNLPWSIKTSEQLSDLFRGFGKVKFSDLPNNKGKLFGFGFVTLRGRKNAEKAMEAINGKEIDGRTLAVDWAVDKQTWEKKTQGDEGEEEAPAKADKKTKTKKAKPAEDDEDDDKEGMTQEDKDLINFFKSQGENLESESEEGSEDEKHEDQDEDEGEEEEGDEDDSDDGGADLELSDVSEDEEEEKPAPKKFTTNETTVFIRNLPYTATDETLKAHFDHFGAVRYARVVKDRATDRPAGTGFVCFFKDEDFKACVKGAPRRGPAPTASKHSVLQDETADPSGKYTMEGRVLQVTHAVDKDEATRLANEAIGGRNSKDKDKRRLFLLSEGSIPASSPLYQKLSATEIRMRETSAKQRKKMIQSNPSLHLSLTRLALRNIPRNMSSKELKALAREAVVGFAKDVKEGRRQPLSKEENTRGGQADKEAEHHRREKKKGVVKQAKIVFESNEGTKIAEDSGAGKSRGYGFIEYSSHRWALMGLRYLNGHALKNEAGKHQTLIVEFAIENANVVQRRQQQVGRGKQVTGGKPGEKSDKKFGASGGRGRDIHKSKSAWKEYKRGKEARAAEEAKKDGASDPLASKAVKQNADAKLALRTKIIARKRMMRKKKGEIRAGK